MAADDFDETASANVVLPSPSRAGDLIVLAIGWFDKTSSVTGVVDSAGNEYKQVSAPTRLDSDDGPVTQQLFFAAGVVAGAREITVSWDVDATNPDIRVAEFQGLDTAQPLATSSVNKTDALSVVSKPLTTGGPSLLFAGMTTQGSTVQGDPAAVSPLITKQKNLAQWVIVDRGSHSLKATQQIEIGDGFAVEAITEVAAFR